MTKTYTLHKWAYTPWMWGNNLSKVPSRIWLMAFLMFKRDAASVVGAGTWIHYLDEATTFHYYKGYVDSRTSDNFPFGHIRPNQE